MPFTAGVSGNLNGRPKGAKNKHVKPLRLLITNFAEDKFPEIVEEFEKLEPKEKLKFYIDILQYSLPKLQSISNEAGAEKAQEEQFIIFSDGTKLPFP
jgi:hypothetical protein